MENTNNATSPGGVLIAKVTTAGGTIPVEGGLVYIKKFGDAPEGSDLIYSLRTNSQGFSPAVSLPTPPKSASQTPNNGTLPYSQYIMTVKKEGYYTVENIGIPMFEGITAIQPVELLPLSESDMLSDERPEEFIFENDGYLNLRGGNNNEIDFSEVSK